MSFLVSEWASEAAPVADTYERIILMKLASHASDDGRAAHPSVPSMARAALCDTETVKRRLKAMLGRKLIAYGDQRRVAHYRPDRRPRVYDLMVPADWYSAEQLAKVNRDCAEMGLELVTPLNRPPIAAAPPRRGRADKGVARGPKTAATKATRALVEPPSEPVDNSHGGSQRAVDGGSLSRATGALVEPQISQIETSPSTTSQSAACLPGVTSNVDSSGARLLRRLSLPVTAQVIRQHHEAVTELLQTWPEEALIRHLEAEAGGSGVRSPMAVLVSVIRNTEPYRSTAVETSRSSGHRAVSPICGQCDARYDSDPVSARVVWLDIDHRHSSPCPRCHPAAVNNPHQEIQS